MLRRELHVPASLPGNHPPVLLVIVDTEEEFHWGQPLSRSNIATGTIAAQPIAHKRLFDKFGIVPTYVVDWPVATATSASAILRSLLENKQCEIGAHLHPWVSPPHQEVVSAFNSYPGNLPKALELEKLRHLTDAIVANFGIQPLTFKAGRHGVGPHTAELIASLGYRIDASIVPRTRFDADGGPDFSDFSEQPFWFGNSAQPMLELPSTTGFCGRLRHVGAALYPVLSTGALNAMHLPGFAARSGLLERIRLTPEGANASDLIRLTSSLRRDGCQVFTLTYHSPSLIPGHTPYVRSEKDLKNFFSTLDEYCTYFCGELGGIFMSVSQLHQALSAARPALR